MRSNIVHVIVMFIAGMLNLGSVAWGGIQADGQPSGIDENSEVQYVLIPTEEVREQDQANYYRVPDFNRVEIIEEGQLRLKDLKDKIPKATGPNEVNIDGLSKLQVRSLDLTRFKVTRVNDSGHDLVEIPFTVSVLFQRDRKITYIINSEGLIHLQVDKDTDEISGVKILTFDDSKDWERLVARKMGLLRLFDGNFLRRVVPTVIRDFYSKGSNLQNLVDWAEQNMKPESNEPKGPEKQQVTEPNQIQI